MALEVPVLATRIGNLLAGVLVITINAISTTGILNNVTPGQISDRYFTVITPAGYAFSIWSVIYTFVIAFLIYQLVPSTYENEAINHGIGFAWIMNAVLNSCWIFAWHYEVFNLWLSVIFMIGILASLLLIVLRLSLKHRPADSWLQYVLIHIPWSLYLGWIVAASILNIYSTVTKDEPAYVGAGVVGLILALIVENGLAIWRFDPFISGVACWASLAIALEPKHTYTEITATAFAVAAVSGLVCGVLIAANVAFNAGRLKRPWK